MASRYLVGIDLGTTNVAVAYVDQQTLADDVPPQVEMFPIPQLVQEGEMGDSELLPSFILIPQEVVAAEKLAVPWDADRTYAIGQWARDYGSLLPTRLVWSSKSWLTYSGVDRRGALLPKDAEPEFPKISPVEAAKRILEHVRDAWNHVHPDPAHRLENQEIVLTVPASFDAVARDLTRDAASEAGLHHVILFEEPQAAFYAWVHQLGDGWRKAVGPGDVVLVVDVGGGTSDFSLIGVSEDEGNLKLERIAVGDHLLLGGDNMDREVAEVAGEQIKQAGSKLSRAQIDALLHQARQAKEEFLSGSSKKSFTVKVLGGGSKLIKGMIKTELAPAQVQPALLDGFFPFASLGEVPNEQRTVGLMEEGLPYARDVAVTRHLAAFVGRHEQEIRQFVPSDRPAAPTALLLNGGVFNSPLLQNRVTEVVNQWNDRPVRLLASAGLDRAVAVGAAYYSLVRKGRGIRIRGGVPRSYYLGVASSRPSVPGRPAPIRAVCVVPQGTEEGTDLSLPALPLLLVVGEPVQFRFLASTVRKHDRPGTVVDDWEDEIEELAPLATTIEPKAGQKRGDMVPVLLQGKVTEVGTLEIWCQSRDSDDRWKLEFNVREGANG